MSKFSKQSKQLLEQVHPDLQIILNEAIKYIDFSILSSTIRTEEEQRKFVSEGKSQTMNSKHLKKFLPEYNQEYSLAVDIAPYPINWNDKEKFCLLAGYILGISKVYKEEGFIKHNIIWGGNWKTLVDMPHFEIEEK